MFFLWYRKIENSFPWTFAWKKTKIAQSIARTKNAKTQTKAVKHAKENTSESIITNAWNLIIIHNFKVLVSVAHKIQVLEWKHLQNAISKRENLDRKKKHKKETKVKPTPQCFLKGEKEKHNKFKKTDSPKKENNDQQQKKPSMLRFLCQPKVV